MREQFVFFCRQFSFGRLHDPTVVKQLIDIKIPIHVSHAGHLVRSLYGPDMTENDLKSLELLLEAGMPPPKESSSLTHQTVALSDYQVKAAWLFVRRDVESLF